VPYLFLSPTVVVESLSGQSFLTANRFFNAEVLRKLPLKSTRESGRGHLLPSVLLVLPIAPDPQPKAFVCMPPPQLERKVLFRHEKRTCCCMAAIWSGVMLAMCSCAIFIISGLNMPAIASHTPQRPSPSSLVNVASLTHRHTQSLLNVMRVLISWISYSTTLEHGERRAKSS